MITHRVNKRRAGRPADMSPNPARSTRVVWHDAQGRNSGQQPNEFPPLWKNIFPKRFLGLWIQVCMNINENRWNENLTTRIIIRKSNGFDKRFCWSPPAPPSHSTPSPKAFVEIRKNQATCSAAVVQFWRLGKMNLYSTCPSYDSAQNYMQSHRD